jgi:tetratricopeptide (TPR) repeat protein
MTLSKTSLLGLILCMLSLFVQAEGKDYRQQVAEGILKKLYDRTGQYRFTIPKLVMSNENNKVAAYYPGRNQIILDVKAYDACVALGKDSLHALAFILGHELAHSFQVEIRDGKTVTNFLSYDKHYHATTRIEKVADIQGAFSAFLAGYHVKEVLPKILDRIYDGYGLKGRILRGYPSFDERINTAKEVLEITDELIDVFETANYLIASENYSLAASSLEYVLQFYQGREIYNNLGVLNLLAAMEYYDHTIDRFSYPVELDGSTQLKKLEKARGITRLSLSERLIRNRMIEKASRYFDEALRLDRNYTSAKLNKVCALNMLGSSKEAMEFYRKNKLSNRKKNRSVAYEKMQMAYGITAALLNNKMIADATFYSLTQSPYPLYAVQAQFNLDVLQGKEMNRSFVSNTYVFPSDFIRVAKTVELGRMSHLSPTLMDEESGLQFRREVKGNTRTLSFGTAARNMVSIIRFKNAHAPQLDLFDKAGSLDRQFFHNLVTTPDGYFLKSDNDGVVVRLNNDGKVMEVARVYQH